MSFLFSLLLMMTIIPMNIYSLISIRVGSVFIIDVNVNLNNNVDIKINMNSSINEKTNVIANTNNNIYTGVHFSLDLLPS